MAKDQNSQKEDSMEDILHSIRDIVSGDGAKKEESPQSLANASPVDASAQNTSSDDDVLELTELVLDESMQETSPQQVSPIAPQAAPQASPVTAPEPEILTTPPQASPVQETMSEISSPSANSGDVLSDIDQALDTVKPSEVAAAATPPPPPPPVVQEKPVAEAPVIEQNTKVEAVQNKAPETQKTEAPPIPEKVQAAPKPPEVKVAEQPKNANAQADSLISDTAAQAASKAMKGLVESIPQPKIESPEFRSGTNVEDLVKETLKPMLAEWLNSNLPVIVENIVQKEVKKLIPRE